MIGFLMAILFFTGCKKKDTVDPALSVAPSEIILPSDGGKADVTINGNAQWTIGNLASWLQSSTSSGNSGSNTIQLTATSNETGAARFIFLSVNSSNGQARNVKVSQPPRLYPSYNTSPKAPDSTGMSTAVQLASNFKFGWNIGNTLEATGGETSWGNPLITESYVKFVKQQGFTAIRLPCAWDLHVDNKATAHIDPKWMNRVKEVVGYCVNNGLYVMLNIHWDGGWLENNCTPDKKDAVNDKQKAYWEQIATTMRDFDEHLMFASANEPNVDNAIKNDVLSSYNQTFVDAVRSTGGRNRYRVLVVQGNSELEVKFPNDQVPGRLIYEEHNYTPFQFTALNSDVSWGNMFYYWGAGNHSAVEPGRNASWGEEEFLNAYFLRIKEKFTDKGIPVIMGEYGAYRRTDPLDMEKHQASVDHWITFVTKKALAHGLKPFWWDTGGALDRRNDTVLDQRTIDAIMEGGK